MQCIDSGRLRAYLDNELPSLEAADVASHITACAACRADLKHIGQVADQSAALLATAAAPDAQAALARLRLRQPAPAIQPTEEKSVYTTKRSSSGPRRAAITTIASLVLLLGLLALPPVRAAADDLLQIFRVRSVVFVPVDRDRMQQLDNLNFDGKTLFLAEPTFEGDTEPQTVADAAAAASATGLTIAAPSEFPSAPTSETYQVMGEKTGSFQVDVASARELLALLDVKDVTLPDALGEAPITVNVQPMASTSFQGNGYRASLTQGISPEVTLPDGVDLSQLGSAMLQILGSSPDQARAMAQSIDWSSTLVVPIPTDLTQVQQVTVNGTAAMLVEGRSDSTYRSNSVLYWQNGDRFYVLEATGLEATEMIVAAESVK